MTVSTSIESQDKHTSVYAENVALREQLIIQTDHVKELKRQLDWFTRQLFGSKTEKRLEVDTFHQTDLLSSLGVTPPLSKKQATERISYERRKKQRDANTVSDTGLRFDENVPIETINVLNPEVDGLSSEQRQHISEKITYRLAQRPGSYVVLKYIRQVIKQTDTQMIHTAAMPPNVLEKSVAEVSFLAGMLIDKFLYHLPLYRQH